jgi:hypothetical protein
MTVVDAQYRIIRFNLASGTRYLGIAWNYDSACMITTRDCPTYTDARAALGSECQARSVRLRWFDGEYVCVKGELIAVDDSFKNELDYAAASKDNSHVIA